MTDAKREAYLQRTYGITLRIYRAMLVDQNGACGICGDPPKPGKNLHVDHDHKTGRVRGLLDYKCNKILLGRGRENADRHEKAARYLRQTLDWRTV